jgi:hypothetical protein
MQLLVITDFGMKNLYIYKFLLYSYVNMNSLCNGLLMIKNRFLDKIIILNR